ncbi:NXPE family member 3-like protein [Labeo rohita]|uniref:NXPE family member 3-like protein n=1 Tax=Labeo rohita TaxID=84645 RepID=A0A498LWA1_LABRO|nr:NXPE family member 3-like protein [Labeo rohita]
MEISDEEWERLQKVIEWPGPDQEITHLNQSTSPVHSSFAIVGLKESYKVGEKISVTITARDHNKNLKRYGGDFFKAKLFNSELKASVYGEVVDHRNGTYSVDFLLPWEGIKRMDLHTPHALGPLEAVELKNNIIIHWRPHGVPLRFRKMPVIDLPYISTYIDTIAGGRHAAIAFTYAAHLVLHPITFYVHKVAKIRQSVVSLLSRAPETTVIIKSGNTAGLKALWAMNGGIHIKQFQPPRPKPVPRNKNSSTISASDMGISDEEWERLQKVIEWPGPDQEITHLNQSTSPVHSSFSVVGLKESYKVGEKISVTITARDHNKNLKQYGGDFFKAKLFDSELKASVYGEVVDHRNGTYSVNFLLPWKGQAQVFVRLEHSSEVVQILKKYRDSSFPRTHYQGYFESGPSKTRIRDVVECNLKWGADGSWRKGNCCCTVEKCSSGLKTPVPAGFYLKDIWKSFVCNTRQFSTAEMVNCLKNKIVYLLGDSTTRQWFEYFEKTVPGKPHGVPLRFRKMPMIDLPYISNYIDTIAGGRHAAIAFTYAAHLVLHPITFYVHKVAKIRQSVVSLLSRAPETTVIIKSGNTAGIKLDTVMREMFRDIDGVIFLDVWQMTSCHYLVENIHPGPVIIANEIDMLLSYICPRDIMSAFNTKIGTDNTGYGQVMGTRGLGVMSEN